MTPVSMVGFNFDILFFFQVKTVKSRTERKLILVETTKIRLTAHFTMIWFQFFSFFFSAAARNSIFWHYLRNLVQYVFHMNEKDLDICFRPTKIFVLLIIAHTCIDFERRPPCYVGKGVESSIEHRSSFESVLFVGLMEGVSCNCKLEISNVNLELIVAPGKGNMVGDDKNISKFQNSKIFYSGLVESNYACFRRNNILWISPSYTQRDT